MCCFCLIGAASGHLAEKAGIGEISFLLLATLMTLAMTGLYAGSETALVSVDKSFINKSLADGDERAKIVKTLTRSHNRMLGLTLVGTNIMHVATSELGLILVVSILSYSEVTAELLQHWHIKPVLVATVITTSLILVFAEILPKTIFRAQANNFSSSICLLPEDLRHYFSSHRQCGYPSSPSVNAICWTESKECQRQTR